MNKVLITGGAGFIGLHLARRLLENGHEVHLLDNFSRGVRDSELEEFSGRKGVELIDADLLRGDALQQLGDNYGYIYHLAAIIGVRNVNDRPYAVLHDNFLMLAAVIELCRRQRDLRRLIFTSTSEVYAGTLHYFGMKVPTPESTPLALTDVAEKRTTYMLSKIYGEALCRHSGIDFTIIRPHNFYGPRMGMSHVIPELLQKVYNKEDRGILDVYSVDHRRSFCYIADAVEMIVRTAENNDCCGEAINIGSEDGEITIGELARIILEVTGKNLDINPLPATPGSPVRRCPDMGKAFTLTGFKAETDLKAGIEQTYTWYRDYVFEGKDACAR